MLKVTEIVQTVKSLVETRINIVKQEVQDEFLGIVSRTILLIVIGGLTLLVLLFFSLSLAFYLSTYFESPFLGFLIVGLLYLVLLLALYMGRYSIGIQEKVQGGLKDFIFSKIKKREEKEDE